MATPCQGYHLPVATTTKVSTSKIIILNDCHIIAPTVVVVFNDRHVVSSAISSVVVILNDGDIVSTTQISIVIVLDNRYIATSTDAVNGGDIASIVSARVSAISVSVTAVVVV